MMKCFLSTFLISTENYIRSPIIIYIFVTLFFIIEALYVDNIYSELTSFFDSNLFELSAFWPDRKVLLFMFSAQLNCERFIIMLLIKPIASTIRILFSLGFYAEVMKLLVSPLRLLFLLNLF